MYNTDDYTANVTRYNNTGQHLTSISHDSTGQGLYREPIYITENRNGDVIVSDWNRGVVVTDQRGNHRFSYRGPPSETRINIRPRGVCTDALLHILVCDLKSHSVHMIDKDGKCLSLIQTQQEINRPQSLSYDDKTHCFWVGSWNNNKVCVYRYISRHDYTGR
ncbi:uncharacterized protein LOC134250597 [Saccostrea cucullata]|uniref:uncharacterized protein LOC134250597 n=1 Tax=Saccostrea cuccullata TaxID=36930 RepID=UPI002ED3395F